MKIITVKMSLEDKVLNSKMKTEEVPDDPISIERMQSEVGGQLIDIMSAEIETDPPIQLAAVFCVDRKVQQYSPLATKFGHAYDLIEPTDFIVGDVMFAKDAGDEILPFTPEEAKMVKEFLFGMLR